MEISLRAEPTRMLCYITPEFSGVPTKGGKITMGCLNRGFSGAQRWEERLHNLCILRGPHLRGPIQEWLPNPYLLGAHNWAEMLHNPCTPQRSPTEGTKSEVVA